MRGARGQAPAADVDFYAWSRPMFRNAAWLRASHERVEHEANRVTRIARHDERGCRLRCGKRGLSQQIDRSEPLLIAKASEPRGRNAEVMAFQNRIAIFFNPSLHGRRGLRVGVWNVHINDRVTFILRLVPG